MREDKPLDAHEARATREGHGQRALICSGEHLDAKRHRHRALHFVTDDGERGNNLGPTLPLRYGRSCVFSIITPWKPADT